jgi:hypothetical protein
MQPLPQLETLLQLAFDARAEVAPSGIALASYFARAPTRGRRRSDLDLALLFAQAGLPQDAIALAADPASWKSCEAPRPLEPIATREWLSEAALTLGKAEGYALTWALLRAMTELEGVAQKLLGARTPRAVVRQVLHGVSTRALHVEPFAALLVRVLKIAQTVYVAYRHAGRDHEAAFAAVKHRLWEPHPTGKNGDERGAYLPSLVQAASGNARRKLKRSAQEGRTQEHARAFLGRFATVTPKLWPWVSADEHLQPFGEKTLTPELAGLACFVLLTHTAAERRSRGGPSGGLSAAFAAAGFAAPEWLPDRTDELAVRLLTASGGAVRGEFLSPLAQLLRAALSSAEDERLFELLRWLEENGRELLERA